MGNVVGWLLHPLGTWAHEWGNFLGHTFIMYGVTTAAYTAVVGAAVCSAVGTVWGSTLWLRNDPSWRHWLLGGVLSGVAFIPLTYTAALSTAVSVMTIQGRPIPWPRALRALFGEREPLPRSSCQA
jgi:hypothetical protein